MVITDTMCDVGLNNGANMRLCPRKDMVGKSTPFILDCDVGLSGHQTGTIITNPTLDANDILSFATLLNSSLAMGIHCSPEGHNNSATLLGSFCWKVAYSKVMGVRKGASHMI